MGTIRNKICGEFSYYTGKYYSPCKYVSLIITHQCNFRCLACDIWKKETGSELGEKSWLAAIEQLNKTLPANTFIEINGGEPLIRKDLAVKMTVKLKKHFSVVALNTNGSLLDKEIVAELEESGLDIIKISLYSLDPHIHNTMRGMDLSWQKAIEAIGLVSQSKIKVEIGALITSKNIHGIPELIKWSGKQRNTSVILQLLDEKIESAEAKNTSENLLPLKLWPEKSDVAKLFTWIKNNSHNIKNPQISLKNMEKYYLDPRSALKYRCFAGQRNLVVNPDGGIQLCFKRMPIGNISGGSLLNTLGSKEACNERRNIRKCAKYCRIMGCNFSRGFLEFAKDKFQARLYTDKY